MNVGVLRAVRAMCKQLRRAFKIMGFLGDWLQATNGIMQGCPLPVVFINMLTMVWKKEIDPLNTAFKVRVRDLPPRPDGGLPMEVSTGQGPRLWDLAGTCHSSPSRTTQASNPSNPGNPYSASNPFNPGNPYPVSPVSGASGGEEPTAFVARIRSVLWRSPRATPHLC